MTCNAARRRVKQKMGFYIHPTVYLLVNLGLAAINLASGGKAWHLWPLAGWGLGLAIHGFVTFASLRRRWPALSACCKRREVERLATATQQGRRCDRRRVDRIDACPPPPKKKPPSPAISCAP